MALEKMGISVRPVGCGTEILHNDAVLGDALTLDQSAFTDGVCLAGTPVTKDGKVASGEDAFGILLGDVREDRPQGTAVIGGYVAVQRAEAHSGVKISDVMKNAMKNVAFL